MAVHQLHMGPINAIAVHEGFAVTASDDKFMRVWPLDFTDYLLEVRARVWRVWRGLGKGLMRVVRV